MLLPCVYLDLYFSICTSNKISRNLKSSGINAENLVNIAIAYIVICNIVSIYKVSKQVINKLLQLLSVLKASV